MQHSYQELNIRSKIEVMYHSPSIEQEENAITEVSKRECVIMGDFNHDHILLKSLESAGSDDHQFVLLTQGCFLTQKRRNFNNKEMRTYLTYIYIGIT